MQKVGGAGRASPPRRHRKAHGEERRQRFVVRIGRGARRTPAAQVERLSAAGAPPAHTLFAAAALRQRGDSGGRQQEAAAAWQSRHQAHGVACERRVLSSNLADTVCHGRASAGSFNGARSGTNLVDIAAALRSLATQRGREAAAAAHLDQKGGARQESAPLWSRCSEVTSLALLPLPTTSAASSATCGRLPASGASCVFSSRPRRSR